VSSPRTRTSPVPARERAACMCATGADCSSYAPGHALHLIQARLASATPAEWVDAFVESVDPTRGELTVRTLNGEAVTLWSGAGAAASVALGLPIALHARYDVLAVGTVRFNCLRG